MPADAGALRAPSPLSRTAAILDAIRRQLEQRRVMLDAADDLGAFTVTVKLDRGTSLVKSVTCSDERVATPRQNYVAARRSEP